MDALAAIRTMNNLEGKILDIGCGPGAFGVMLCDRTGFSTTTGLERSSTLVRVGEAVSSRFGYAGRISFKIWNDELLPFDDGQFDAVVSFHSLHGWKNPLKTFAEIERVRKRDSLVFITDLRRDQMFLPSYISSRKIRLSFGREIASNFLNSLKASHTTEEVNDLLSKLKMNNWRMEKNGRWLKVISSSFVNKERRQEGVLSAEEISRAGEVRNED